ncbi:ABC-type xylose transport system permease component [Gaiella occulta]|uniref:Xylose transport system permease protein XylH n=1 Tax=Gaiella occulta TaxID=1002870 RepID=A0A7M2YZC1_9ACTN|nr:sugar ABC transporter permease [Gaiella occulta]RDI75495.1 ABC-type xylose transport system permease component [Gaiella occulta]
MTDGDVQAAAPAFAGETFSQRVRDNIRAGNLGSWPVVIGLAVIVLFFSLKANNFFTPSNFINIITQMAGVTMLAYGVVFVLLLGEIDLSISYVSGIAGVVVAQLTLAGSGHQIPGLVAIALAIAACAAIGAFQGSFVAFIGVPAFVVTLAGFQIWQGVIQKSIPQGVLVIQDDTVNNVANYFFSDGVGWIIAGVVSAVYVAGVLSGVLARRRHGVAVRDPFLVAAKLVGVTAVAFATVAICNRDRGVPFVLLLIVAMLLLWTYVAKRTTFGRHVYAVGGNAEAARRAGINVVRVRILVFMISSGMAGLGGIVLAARLNSVDLNAGGGTLLIDAIAAAVIGGTSLFGGRGEVRDALFGSLVIATIANGLNTLNLTQGVIFVVTGAILLFAVTLDTVLRRRQTKAGR